MKGRKFRFKSLKFRSIKMIIIAFLCMAVMSYLILSIIMMKGINIVENKYIHEHMIRVQNTITSKLDNLYATVYDWAVWDDTYQYIEDHNERFEESNLMVETFRNLEINAIILIDDSGEYVYVGYMDQTNEEMISAPQDFLDYIHQSPICRNTDTDYRMQGIINLPEGPMLIAAAPILTSGGSGPVRGNLVMGYYLDDAMVENLAEQLNLDLEVEMLSQNEIKNLSIESGESTVQILSKNRIACISYMSDIYDEPAIRLNIIMEREINHIGKAAINQVLIVLVLVGLVFSFSVMVFFDRNIISRISVLCANIKDIGEKRMFSSRLQPEKFNDELNVVSMKINYMISELEKAQISLINSEEALKESNNELEKRVQERTRDLNSSNEKLREEIAEREKMEERMKYLAYHDFLTDLPNKLMMTDSINHAISLANRLGNFVAIMYIDLDGFKMINDSAGHVAGDMLLKEVSRRLVQLLRKSDIVGRNGGDEFLFVAEDLNQYPDAEIIAKKILDSFHDPFIINHKEYFLTTSIGIAFYPEDGQNAETLIKNADLAMYKAKENGKNQFVLCSPILKDKINRMMEVMSKLHRAIEKNELELYYQPQVTVGIEKIVGVEALLRWNHPELGLVSPSEFITIAEQTGLIIPIGEWVLKTACMQNKRWQDAGYPKMRMAINLSIKQFQNNNLVEQIGLSLEETGLSPDYLELEITESVMMEEANYIVEKLNLLKNMGIQIAIDDFGTEYSSLSYLKHLPIDRLKIAMPFVQGIENNKADESIIKAVLVLAKSMGLGVIAEGVENESQLAFLAQNNCDEVQGYYYYKPMPATYMEELLKKLQA